MTGATADLAAQIAAAELRLGAAGYPPKVRQAAVRRAVRTAARAASALDEADQVAATMRLLERELAGAERWCAGVMG